MDALLNAGKAAGFAAAKGKKINTKVFTCNAFNKLTDELDKSINDVEKIGDIIWIDTNIVSQYTREINICTIIYYVER